MYFNEISQEEAEKKTVCVKCKWCSSKSVEHDCWTEYTFKCRNAVTSIDLVTGDETYADCRLVNTEGECENFSPTENKIYSLFKKKQ